MLLSNLGSSQTLQLRWGFQEVHFAVGVFVRCFIHPRLCLLDNSLIHSLHYLFTKFTHFFIYHIIHSLPQPTRLFTRSHPFILSPICIHSLAPSSIHSVFICSFAHYVHPRSVSPVSPLFIHFLLHSPSCSPSHTFPHERIHSLICSL